MSYGPSLPPHLQKNRSNSSSESESDDEPLGPKLPEVPCRGPPPPKDSNQESDTEEASFGPALPPGLSQRDSERKAEMDQDDDDDSDMIGPMPPIPGQSSSSSSVAADFEARSKRMRDRLEGKDEDKAPKRESWMLDLPPEISKNFGLGPRQFNRTSEPKDERKVKESRSAWTETPEQKAKRARGEVVEESTDPSQDQDVLEYMASIQRDQEMEKISKDLKEKRGTSSLMDMHTKKLQQNQKQEKSGASERRPFDRDVDLQANRFDNAQKEMMLKRARQLDSRFSAGASKFL